MVAGFDGGAITSDAGALLLRHVDGAIGLFDRVAACFVDGGDRKCTVHSVRTLIGQRIAANALGYEEVDDHDGPQRRAAAGIEFRNEIVTGPGGSQILLIGPSRNLVELFQPARG